MIEVVAGLIKCGDKYLIAKRTYGDKEAIGKWEFPGGKIEPLETDELAIIREAKEELGIDVKVLKYLCEYTQIYDTRTIHLKLYEVIKINGEININAEHTEYKLVDFNDIKNYDLAPADRCLYESINIDELI